MKKLAFLLSMLLMISVKIFSQSDVVGITGHIGVSGYYVGWDATTTIPLEIRTYNTGVNAQPIRFFTNGTTQHMEIDGLTVYLGVGTTLLEIPLRFKWN